MRDYLRRKGGEAYATGFSVGRKEGISLGREEGDYQNKLETARTLLSMGLPPARVAQGTNLPLETIQELMNSYG